MFKKLCVFKNVPLFFPRFNCSYTRSMSINVNKPIIYGDIASPPVRFVLMTASALGIETVYREIDLFAGKNKTEFYKKINPLQKVPAMEVQDHVICDSHAISLYLCRLSGDKTLYPKDIHVKAKIDELLFFNSGTLFPIDSALFTDYFAGRWPVNPIRIDVLNSALDHLEFHLNKNIWMACEEMSLSDICLMSTVSSIYQMIPKTHRHQKINKWLERCEALPFFEINRLGLERLKSFVTTTKTDN